MKELNDFAAKLAAHLHSTRTVYAVSASTRIVRDTKGATQEISVHVSEDGHKWKVRPGSQITIPKSGPWAAIIYSLLQSETLRNESPCK